MGNRTLIKFCKTCFDRIRYRSITTIDFYLHIISNEADDITLFVKTSKRGQVHKSITWLEREGFITTTEADEEWVSIRLNGLHHLEKKNYLICIQPECHGDEPILEDF